MIMCVQAERGEDDIAQEENQSLGFQISPNQEQDQYDPEPEDRIHSHLLAVADLKGRNSKEYERQESN